MKSSASASAGFTLIELMVTLTVIVILLLIAVPSFEAFRQRSATRGAGEQVLGLWNQARFEAAKRNLPVEVSVTGTPGNDFCVGATTVESSNTLPCDCLETVATEVDFCDVARYPTYQNSWKRVSLAATPTIGTTTGAGRAVIEPKRTSLTQATDAGVISLLGPPGSRSYRLNLAIDAFGRGRLCESTATVDRMSDYANRRCAP